MKSKKGTKRRSVIRIVALAIAALCVGATVTACTTTTPEAMCAFVVGDGQNGHDTNIHRVVLPGQSMGNTEGENSRYVPCNSRNYKINDGSEVVNVGDSSDPNKTQKVGDRFTPSKAYTKDGTPVLVWSNAYWTLNQTEPALKAFYNVCYKYTCYSTDNSAGAANYSTPGWNGMLGENFGPSVDEVVLSAAAQVTDDVWRQQASDLRDQMATAMSNGFAAAMQKKFGINEDIFCGSGNSGWDEAHKNFNCTQVRFEVTRVDRYVPSSQEAASTPESQQKLNADRLNAAKALYGDSAGYWLGVQDSIAACNAKGAQCQIYVGQPPTVPTR